MSYLNFKSAYDKNPKIFISNENKLLTGSKTIVKTLSDITSGVLVFETYPGVDLEQLKREILLPLKPDNLILIEDYSKSTEQLNDYLAYNLTDDRVFGVYSHHTIDQLYQMDKVNQLNSKIKSNKGLTIVYGFGASLIDSTHLVHVSLTRWEIQLRFRKGLSNFKANNSSEDNLRKYKRGFFVEWRIADRIKDHIKDDVLYTIDYNNLDKPVMIDQKIYHQALKDVTKKTF